MNFENRITAELRKEQEAQGSRSSTTVSIRDLITDYSYLAEECDDDDNNGDNDDDDSVLFETSPEAQQQIWEKIQWEKLQNNPFVEPDDKEGNGCTGEEDERDHVVRSIRSAASAGVGPTSSIEPSLVEKMHQQIRQDLEQDSVRDVGVSIADIIDPIVAANSLERSESLPSNKNDEGQQTQERQEKQQIVPEGPEEPRAEEPEFVSFRSPRTNLSLISEESQSTALSSPCSVNIPKSSFGSISSPRGWRLRKNSENQQQQQQQEQQLDGKQLSLDEGTAPPHFSRQVDVNRRPSAHFPGAYAVHGVDSDASSIESYDNLAEPSMEFRVVKDELRRSIARQSIKEEEILTFDEEERKQERESAKRRKRRTRLLLIGMALGILVVAVAVGAVVRILAPGSSDSEDNGGSQNIAATPMPVNMAPTAAPTIPQLPTLPPITQQWAFWNDIFPLPLPTSDEAGASLSLQPNLTIAIGSPGFNNGRGMVQVIHNDTGAQIGNTLLGTGPGERLGSKVILSEDSSVLAVYSEGSDGTVQVYRLVKNNTSNSSGVWVRVAPTLDPVLVATLGVVSVRRVVDFSMSGDGTTVAVATVESLVVLSLQDDRRDWKQLGQSLRSAQDVSLSRDGETMLVTGRTRADVEVYIFQFNEWNRLKQPPAFSDYDLTGAELFGYSLSTGGAKMAANGKAFVVADQENWSIVVCTIDRANKSWRNERAFTTIVVDAMDVTINADGTKVTAVYGTDKSTAIESFEQRAPLLWKKTESTLIGGPNTHVSIDTFDRIVGVGKPQDGQVSLYELLTLN